MNMKDSKASDSRVKERVSALHKTGINTLTPKRASQEIRDQYPAYAYHEMPGDDGAEGFYVNDGMITK